MIGPLAARLGEGVVVQLSSEKVRELIDLSESTDTAHIVRHGVEEIRKHGHFQQEYLRMLYDLLSKEYAAPLDEIIVLQATPNFLELSAKDRKHNLIMVASATNVLITVAGVGTISYTLQPGWNQLDLPDDSQIALASGQNQTMLYRCTNTLMV
jgi:hypothetical protein